MLRQSQILQTRPLTSAHLAQTMTLLELTAFELKQKIDNELATNPALELIDERFCPSCGRALGTSRFCPICSAPVANHNNEPVVFVSSSDDYLPSAHYSNEQEDNYDEYTPEREDLATYVLRQIAPELEPQERFMAVHILTSLDEDGLLRTHPIEIAQYHHVPVAQVERIQKLIQKSDPVGVGSCSPQEALLVQLELFSETMPIAQLALIAVKQGMEFLYRHQHSELARLLNLSQAEVQEVIHFIANNLNPYPARAYWGELNQSKPADNDVYYTPDIIISFLNNEPDAPLMVEVISPMFGKLRINPLFRDALQDAPKTRLEQWKSDIERASLLIKCIQQRNHTIVRLMQILVKQQKSFILEGDAHLIPTTRASLAERLGVHESTISRAVADKTVQIPNGKIIPLSKFFDRSLPVRSELLNIISKESKPLTDTQIADILKKRGYDVARRTVAKYRAIEGIMPAHLRAKFPKTGEIPRLGLLNPGLST
ncbi:MAG: RNA polymerase sigma-54 factor [Anaerolineales bacterium]